MLRSNEPLFRWIFLTVMFAVGLKAAASDAVWQLHTENGRPIDCSVAFAKVVQDGETPSLLADTRTNSGEWHSCLSLPKGLLKSGKDYVVVVDYQVVALSSADSYFYVFARSDGLGMGADHWQKWHGQPGARGEVKLRISPTADDYAITFGIRDRGAIYLRDLKVMNGSGWTELPVTTASGQSPPPPPPTGAKSFAIDPPSNPTGPVLNLKDFGAVPDGAAPPASGPDLNHAAFVAALAKCSELKASKLIVPKGVYRIASGQTIVFKGLKDFTFDGGGSTFLYNQIAGGAGISIQGCTRSVFSNFNLDWDWKIDPLASVGKITAIGPDTSYFDMSFEGAPPLDPKRWITMNPLDEKLRAPGAGNEFGNFGPKTIQQLDPHTVRVWPTWLVPAKAGQLYLLRHYTYEKHGVVMTNNTHLSLRNVTIYSFPGIGFVSGGDQHHFELVDCRITYPSDEKRCITTTADGFHVTQSQGFIRLKNCDFGYMGDDCVNIHDNMHSGVLRVDNHTLVAERIVSWACPYAVGDRVEIRHGDYSPTGFTGILESVSTDSKKGAVTLVFKDTLPAQLDSGAILFNHRYGSHDCIIQNCYFHENRARGVLCNTADWLVEGNRFFHNQFSATLLIADSGPSWSEGFGAQNVIIRNNRFESENSIGASDGAVISVGADNYGDVTRYPLLQNILIQNNVFTETPGPVLEATSFKNLIFQDNTVTNVENTPRGMKMRGGLRAELGDGLWVESNVWTTGKGITAPSLFVDTQTTSEVVCGLNRSSGK